VNLPPIEQSSGATASPLFTYANPTNNNYHTTYYAPSSQQSARSTPPSTLTHVTKSNDGDAPSVAHSLQPNLDQASPRLSSQWDPDSITNHCSACQKKFDKLFSRRHHCRLCGRLFCQDCSNTRSLIPPSALVLKADNRHGGHGGLSFDRNTNEDASVTYVRSQSSGNGAIQSTDDTLLYGKGLEQRILLAPHPQRTCHSCREQLAPLQEELCLRNSNSMRFNFIDEGDQLRRLCNSPLAFTLGHEVRKAAYTLSNLLPGNQAGSVGKVSKRNGFIPSQDYGVYPPPEANPCHIPSGPSCKAIDPTLSSLDNISIPSALLQRARGLAIITACKTGLGFAGLEFGTGLVVARREGGDVDDWSAPSAVWLFGCAWGALVGAQISDHVFLLMTDDAVRLFASDKGSSIQLGADIGVAVGPLGRSAEADIGASAGSLSLGTSQSGVAVAPIYTYSLSKGLYAGLSLDGRILMTRDRVNEKFYGRSLSAHELLSGRVATPPAAQPLYDALKRCRVYGSGVKPLPALPVASARSNQAVNPYNLSGRELETGPDPGVNYY